MKPLFQVESKIDPNAVQSAYRVIEEVIRPTPLMRDPLLSERFECDVFLKREDLQVVRSFKIRGAYHFLRRLPEERRKRGVVCASAGNHAQGVAYSCHLLQVRGTIFMPTTTPRQKVSQVERFGGPWVDVVLTGDTFDDAYEKAVRFADSHQQTFVHPFDDPRIIAAQGTIGLEILRELPFPDAVFLSVGGGGLAAGVGSYVKRMSPGTRIIGVEPAGAPAMKRSLERGERITLESLDSFADGAAVKQVGKLTFDICREVLDDVVLVPEGKICTAILELYNQHAMVVEPAGALPIAALERMREEIKGKRIVCVVSGSNNDIDRMAEIKERSLMEEGLKQYFIIHFPQRAGALREFIDQVLGTDDDITHFEYTKKNNRERGPALVGIELKQKEDYASLVNRMRRHGIQFMELKSAPQLFQLLV